MFPLLLFPIITPLPSRSLIIQLGQVFASGDVITQLYSPVPYSSFNNIHLTCGDHQPFINLAKIFFVREKH
ncbi:hypothetical protein CONCODRAFT_5818 [Conidiobolus coronatus NRRL 28638]|uniref:Uncharacterized protein n=1 Tax=Conidiobolus coronatus (strain ATCC 28846 / CBS 209.66 / NRRL 28638) TaxID=796925 RepID=A0A137P8Z0_CONC2|nr:hypothetical protein CONCODRAFT_5818 [Conidiobolus coronatus NRRL 28638]|eukprot:KXN71477.1 hypothetical protein CONCODRAFT_5818 [Conidiobolus coronatus NRRL 28638]